MPKFKLKHHDNLKIISLFRLGWPVHAIVRKLADNGVDITWGTVKNVIKRYQQGKIGYDHLDQDRLPSFQSITDSDISNVRTALREKRTMTSTDIHRLLAEKGSHTSKTTVHKVIDAAGFTGGAPRYGQMIRHVNKEKRMTFCKTLITKNDSFNDIIFTDECSVQLHGNKIVVYREKDCPAPIIPKPKHPLKIHVWAGISRKGTTSIVIFDGIMTSSYYTETILTHGLLPFIQKVYPNGHRFQQDNDPKHTSKATQQFMRENDINWWNVWPSESPDFNPIEMVWAMMKKRLAKREPRTKDQLQVYIR